MFTWGIKSFKPTGMISPCLHGDRSLHCKVLCNDAFSSVKKDSPSHSFDEFFYRVIEIFRLEKTSKRL